jgi:hypothetical protein
MYTVKPKRREDGRATSVNLRRVQTSCFLVQNSWYGATGNVK